MTSYSQVSFIDDRPSASLRLRELPEHETPRGRIRDHGPAALSDAELLAILLRAGVAGANAVQLGQL